jgi:hypothetical protein
MYKEWVTMERQKKTKKNPQTPTTLPNEYNIVQHHNPDRIDKKFKE